MSNEKAPPPMWAAARGGYENRSFAMAWLAPQTDRHWREPVLVPLERELREQVSQARPAWWVPRRDRHSLVPERALGPQVRPALRGQELLEPRERRAWPVQQTDHPWQELEREPALRVPVPRA
jgi:hypothetical protein